MDNIKINNNEILFSRFSELVRITPCGKNAIRFQGFPDCQVIDENYTLMPQKADCVIEELDNRVKLTQGSLTAELRNNGCVSFYKNGVKILEELPELTFHGGFRNYLNLANGVWKSRVTFKANEGEHFFGMGHSMNNPFDLKGCSFDIINTNANCAMPFVYSSLGYGFLWNNPSIGSVELSNNRTRWNSTACRFVDYVVIGGTPAEVSETLAELTGHAPEMPYWATGFWQSRLRYETQEKLLEVARRYKKENIPVSAIVADYFHWTEQGDYKFDPKYWHDVKAMSDELHDMGTKLVVSVWPTINEHSENYGTMKNRNMLIRTTRGSDRVFEFYGWQAEIDATNEETRKFVWQKLKQNYIDNGVDSLWLDEAEPEIHPEQFDNLIFSKGRGDVVALLYPYYYSKMLYDGYKEMGKEDIITLTRCAYLGSQKFGSLVWSGDIESTFESLKCQVHGAINMSVCGIPWWNTDVGGFYDGDITSDYFKELIVRWFQFGVFSPVLRLHGSRIRHGERSNLKEPSGDPNELWSFGEENFEILKKLVFLRENLRPYIKRYMDEASKTGHPILRPMFFEYPDDEVCYTLDEQYMFGAEIIFAPVVNQGQKTKRFYVPDGEWILTKDKTKYTKGWHEINVGIEDFVALVKADSDVISAFEL